MNGGRVVIDFVWDDIPRGFFYFTSWWWTCCCPPPGPKFPSAAKRITSPFVALNEQMNMQFSKEIQSLLTRDIQQIPGWKLKVNWVLCYCNEHRSYNQQPASFVVLCKLDTVLELPICPILSLARPPDTQPSATQRSDEPKQPASFVVLCKLGPGTHYADQLVRQ